MTDAITGHGTRYGVGDSASPEVFTYLAELFDASPPDPQVDDIEATHYESPDGEREYIPGLTENGEITLEGNFIPGSDTDEYIREWRRSKETRTSKLLYPVSPELFDTFPSYVKGYTCTMPNDDRATFTLTLKVAGKVTRNTDT